MHIFPVGFCWTLPWLQGQHLDILEQMADVEFPMELNWADPQFWLLNLLIHGSGIWVPDLDSRKVCRSLWMFSIACNPQAKRGESRLFHWPVTSCYLLHPVTSCYPVMFHPSILINPSPLAWKKTHAQHPCWYPLIRGSPALKWY